MHRQQTRGRTPLALRKLQSMRVVANVKDFRKISPDIGKSAVLRNILPSVVQGSSKIYPAASFIH